MSEQKIFEFRERAQTTVTPVDPDVLLRRGRALRRRRRLAPAVALAACAALGFGIATFEGGDTRTQAPPAGPSSDEPTTSVPTALGAWDGVLPPGEYELDASLTSGIDGTVRLVGDGWLGWNSGAHWAHAQGTVNWGVAEYSDVIVDRCAADPEAGQSRSEIVRRIARVDGTQVTSPARPATAMGLPATHLQVSVPLVIDCPTGPNQDPVLMSSWEGPDDPTVTVDVWIVEDGDRLLMLVKGVRGTPSPAQLEAVDTAIETLTVLPSQ